LPRFQAAPGGLGIESDSIQVIWKNRKKLREKYWAARTHCALFAIYPYLPCGEAHNGRSGLGAPAQSEKM
jgi:hypothetical protein